MDGSATLSTRTPRTSLAVVLGLTALLVAGLLGVVDAGRPALVGLGTGVVLALSLWLSGWARWRTLGTALASLLVLPVAVGLAVASVGTVVTLGAELFPVASRSGVRPAVVDLVSQVLVVLGCALAAFGASSAGRDVLDADRTAAYVGVVIRTAAVPFVVATALALREVVAFLESNAGMPGPQQIVGDLLRGVLGPLFDPVPGRTHVAVFCLLLALAAATTARAVDALPLTELDPQTDAAPDVAETARAVDRTFRRVSHVAVLVAPVAALVELAFGQRFIAGLFPGVIYELLVAVTAAPRLRGLLWWLFLTSVAIVLAVWFLRRTVRSSADRVGIVVAPYVGGGVLVLAVVAAAGPAIGTVEAALRETPAAPLVDQLVVPIADFYGSGTVALALVVVALFAVVGVAGLLWLALETTYLRDRTAGVTLASAGLFGASAFLAPLDGPTWLVLSGLVGAVVVWDAGTFGASLGREVGAAADTRRTELVHTGGTVAVGAVGALATVGLAGVARGSVSVPSPVALAGLTVCLVAVVALSAALR